MDRRFVVGALVVAIAGVAAADVVDPPEITDPEGDAGLVGVQAPGAFAWGDIVEVSLHGATDATFDLRLTVVDGAPKAEHGVLSVLMKTPTGHFISGFGSFPMVDPPGWFEGAYACVSDVDGAPSGECIDAEMAFRDGVYDVTGLPRAFFGVEGPSATIDVLGAQAGYHVHERTDTVYRQVDEAGPGVPFRFDTLAPSPSEQAAADAAMAPVSQGSDDDVRATPPAAFLALAGTLGVAALLATRRR
ncbi:MAG: hypothetical protein ACT4PT_02665 [Methanobacteriota archaeon]